MKNKQYGEDEEHMEKKIIGLVVCLLMTIATIPPIAGSDTTQVFTPSSSSIQADSFDHWDETEPHRLNPKIQEILDKINITLVQEFMEYLVFEIGNRYTGTEGCEKAATYLYQQFEDMGLQTSYQDWGSWGNRLLSGYFQSQNVIGTHLGTDPESDELLIFNAHYDTVKGTVGAVDDGSGTVGVLAAAYVLSQYEFKRTIQFVAFSGEEQGTLGSFAYARALYEQHTPVLVEFNADMIGKATSTETGSTMRLSLTEDAGWIADIMENTSALYGLDFSIQRWQNINRYARSGYSDYIQFTKLGYESVVVWPGEWDPNMHTPQDDISNVNLSYLVNMTRHIAATMALLADMELEHPQISILHPRFGKIFMDDIEKKTYKHNTPLILGPINIDTAVKQGMFPIETVEFYFDDTLLLTDTEAPYECRLSTPSIGFHKIKVIASDTSGNTATDQMKILFLNR